VAPNRNPLRVQCYTCGSLYSTDAPDCPQFDPKDPAQSKECDIGEACLYYSWRTSNTDISVIRECFPTSILLGSIENPVDPTPLCSTEPVESDTIQACICTSDLCNGINENAGASKSSSSSSSRGRTTTTTPAPRRQTTTTRPPRRRPTTRRPSRTTTTPRPPRRTTTAVARRNESPPAKRKDPNRVQCHQCGSLFSTSSSDPDCTVFSESDSSQQAFCQPGEACLWYSWQKSSTSTAVIRECFSTSILLGSISDPLLPTPTCTPKDISEGASRISACLCESDLCNAYRGADEPRGAVTNPPEQPRTITRRPPTQQSTADPFQTNFNDNNRRRTTRAPATRRPAPTTRAPARTARPTKSKFPNRLNPQDNQLSDNRNKNKANVVHPDKPGLQCFSCGSLLNPNKKCDRFDRTDPAQVQTCTKDEACLMYSWKKSSSEVATLRECFPTRVLLGSISDPLVPKSSCSPRDITDDLNGSIFACLCNNDFCNDDEESPFPGISSSSSSSRGSNDRNSQSSRRPQPTTRRPTTRRPTTRRPTTRRPTTRRPTTRRPTTRRPNNRGSSSLQGCPRQFQSVGRGCYLISNDRVGWIEARKMCEQNNAKLLSIETQDKRADIAVFIRSTIRRRRSEFWISGNDIETEGEWEWAKTREEVPSFGWTEEPFNSPEENCLAWTLIDSSRDRSDGWHSSSCCNNLRYICEL